MDPAWTATCPLTDGQPFRGLFVDSIPEADAFSWGLLPETRMRLMIRPLPDGRAFVISVEAPDEATWQALQAEATTIVKDMRVRPDGP